MSEAMARRLIECLREMTEIVDDRVGDTFHTEVGMAGQLIAEAEASLAAIAGIPIHASRDATNDVLDLAIKPDATGKFAVLCSKCTKAITKA